MPVKNQDSNYFKRVVKATGYSLAGLKSAFIYEQAFRLETYIFIVLLPLAIWLAQTPSQMVLLIGSWLFVMIIELINSAVEATIDRIGMEHHALSGRAKDIGSAAVMLSILLAAAIWAAAVIERVQNL